jgi:hypothetical protein
VPNYLPAARFEELRASFPPSSLFKSAEGGKRHLGNYQSPEPFWAFCADHQPWRELFEFFGSAAFTMDLRKVVRKGLVGARGWRGARRWCAPSRLASRAPFKYVLQPVQTSYQFSRLANGASVAPHTDSASKLVSIILYFTDEDWQDDYGGGTEFYVPKNPELKNNWQNSRVGHEELDLWRVSAFRPNQLTVFVKSRSSYHAVRPVSCPEGMSRDSLNVNVKRITSAD